LLLAHVPSVTALLNVVAVPGHAFNVPEITPGSGFTVTTAVEAQPELGVYVIVAVPADTPFTAPTEFMVATEVLLLAHDTIGIVALLKIVVEPAHTFFVPVIGVTGLTVTAIAEGLFSVPLVLQVPEPSHVIIQ
jgi:hypothetical protein